jgi:hypothetical protein
MCETAVSIATSCGEDGLINLMLVELTRLWAVTLNGAIPRSLLFFGGANQSILVHGLESGAM